MKLLNTALIKIILVFVAGILAGFYMLLSLKLLFIIFTAVFLLFLTAYFRAKSLFFQDVFFGIAGFFLIFFSGILTTQLHLPEHQPFHYTNRFYPEGNPSQPQLLVRVKEHLKPGLYHEKFIAEVEKINGKNVHGNIMLLFENTPDLHVDDRLFFTSELIPIPKPLNPYQFNYKKFMANRGIFHQVRLNQDHFIKLDSEKNSLAGMAAAFRNSIVSALKENNFQKEELGIIEALLLGQRQDISEEIYDNYAAAGVLHILAVSGLHVGIILLIFNSLLSFLNKIKYGKIFKTSILVLLLWGFAVIAGLSPSVVRAVTMFTFVAIALQLKRRTNALNVLFISMLVILMIKPQFIFEVGFQLSYLAVISIVLIQPPLYQLHIPKNKLFKYLWGIFTVTLAAQIGVLPLSLFYFHQFPGLFFISNLVILPFLGIILALGILIMFLAVLKLLPEVFVDIYGFLILTLNDFVRWIAAQEDFLFRDIPFSNLQVLAFYLFILPFIFLLRNFTFKNLVFGFTAVILLQLVFLYEKTEQNSTEFIIFHKSRHTLIGKKENAHFQLYHNLDAAPRKEYAVNNYIRGEKISKFEAEKLRNIYFPQNQLVLMIDSSGVYPKKKFSPKYVLLTQSPEINLDRMIHELHPRAIIADGSNYKFLIPRWKKTCAEEKIPFHYTGKKGALVITY